jgi:ribosomal protein L10
MTDSSVVSMGMQAIQVAITVSAPILIAAAAVGVIMGLFQAVTQIQEVSLSFKYMQENKIPVPKGGFVEGRPITAEQFEALSKIPPREVLVAQMLAGLQSPLTGLVGSLQGIISNLVYTLQALVDKKAEAAKA